MSIRNKTMTNDSKNHNINGTTILFGATKDTIVNSFIDDVQSLWLSGSSNNNTIKVYDNGPPSSIDFLRNHVTVSRPCIIRNMNMMQCSNNSKSSRSTTCSSNNNTTTTITDNTTKNNNDNTSSNNHNKPITLDTLVSYDPNLILTVDVTPDGYGDCIRKVAVVVKQDDDNNNNEHFNDNNSCSCNVVSDNNTTTTTTTTIHDCFVQPEQRSMTIQEFQRKLHQQSILQHRRRRCRNNNTINDTMNRTFAQLQTRTTTTTRSENDSNNNNKDVDQNIQSVITNNNDSDNKDVNDKNGDSDDNDNGDDDDDSVVYYSRQNDCLRSTELQSIWDQIQYRTTFDFVQNVFCTSNDDNDTLNDFDTTTSTSTIIEPTAINLWIGNECNISSLHKDYYENLYYVCSGTKIITLCPPCDILFVNEQEYYYSGTFIQQQQQQKVNIQDTTNKKEWYVQLDNNTNNNNPTSGSSSSKVRWIGGGDVTRKDDIEHIQEFPYIQYTNPITITVHANEMIYIPALWLHHVTQSTETIAINYWYEMNFTSPLYIYFHLLQQMKYVPTIKSQTNMSTDNTKRLAKNDKEIE